MNLRDLDYLVAVAEAGQFGEAAQRCHVSQPTLSMQIKKLESELGLTIFERTPRGAKPTAMGQEVIARARAIQEQVRDLREIARQGADPLATTVRLGIIPTSGPYLLPHILPPLREAYPKLQLHIRELMTRVLLDQLHAGELDAAILSPAFDQRGLEVATLGAEPFVIALPPNHALAGHSEVSSSELFGETVLTLEDGHCLRDQAAVLGQALQLRPRHEIRASSIESLRQMVAGGLGCAVLPELATMGPFAGTSLVVFRRVQDIDVARGIVLAWRKIYPRPDAMRDLARVMRASMAAIMPPPTTALGSPPIGSDAA